MELDSILYLHTADRAKPRVVGGGTRVHSASCRLSTAQVSKIHWLSPGGGLNFMGFYSAPTSDIYLCCSHSRPRSPISRGRVPRRRYDSPPFDGHRGKYMRGHGSPPSPHHRHPFTPSPPPPHSGGRSPPPGKYMVTPHHITTTHSPLS